MFPPPPDEDEIKMNLASCVARKAKFNTEDYPWSEIKMNESCMYQPHMCHIMCLLPNHNPQFALASFCFVDYGYLVF